MQLIDDLRGVLFFRERILFSGQEQRRTCPRNLHEKELKNIEYTKMYTEKKGAMYIRMVYARGICRDKTEGLDR